jgi:hypothetical protein
LRHTVIAQADSLISLDYKIIKKNTHSQSILTFFAIETQLLTLQKGLAILSKI